MDIIILGFLMIQGSTIYELRQSIKNSLSTVSSDSTGSIQAALKKLLNKQMITFKEQVEGGLNKKVYFITDLGKEHFQQSITQPMLYKEKNMELSKFFFMGFADADKWEGLIDAYIGELQKELDRMEQLSARLPSRSQLDQDYWKALRGEGLADEITDELLVFPVGEEPFGHLEIKIRKEIIADARIVVIAPEVEKRIAVAHIARLFVEAAPFVPGDLLVFLQVVMLDESGVVACLGHAAVTGF